MPTLSERIPRERVLSPLGIVAILSLLAISTRLLPLAISTFPFNNDGIAFSRIATDLLSYESLRYPDGASYVGGHGTITPAYSVLLAFVASFIGATPFQIAQICVSIFSVVTIIGGYLIAQMISSSRKGAIAAALFLALFGTFVFLTGSAWSASLGVTLIVLIVLSYIQRSHLQMMVLSVTLLITVVFIHHLAAFIAYLIIVYLTIWSVFCVARNGCLRRRHVIDATVVALLSAGALSYYSFESLNRLSYIEDFDGICKMSVAFLLTSGALIATLSRGKQPRFLFAPIPSALVFILFAWDYFSPIFPYAPGLPPYILLLGLAYSILLFLACFGWEGILGIKSAYRSVPIALLLPVVALIVYVILSGFSLEGHQMIYRSFDFAGVALAMGIAVCVMRLSKRSRMQFVAVLVIIVALLASFPYAYATGTLIGIRRDTQQYEVDCLEWVHNADGHEYWLVSDERISYNALALYDFNRSSTLPQKLVDQIPSYEGFLYVYIEEWAEKGVNDYPEGYVTPSREYVESVLSMSTLLYIGGPSECNIIAYCHPGVAM